MECNREHAKLGIQSVRPMLLPRIGIQSVRSMLLPHISMHCVTAMLLPRACAGPAEAQNALLRRPIDRPHDAEEAEHGGKALLVIIKIPDEWRRADRRVDVGVRVGWRGER